MKITFTHLCSCACATLAALCLGFSASAAETESKESAVSLPRTRQLIAEKKPVRVVVYGDSISEVKTGWNGGAKTPEANWGAVLVKKLQAAYPDVQMGSYPFFEKNRLGTYVVIRAVDEARLDSVLRALWDVIADEGFSAAAADEEPGAL